MPALRDLTDVLGADLVATAELPTEPIEITGVHVSELADPTPYLSGGELLLTTGMQLTGHAAQARSYAARLSACGVAALGFGLGPVHDQVPGALGQACEAQGVPLLVVPPPTPFLTVSRAYWQRLIEDERAGLSTSLGAYQALVRSATRRDPIAQVVRTLGQAISGWAARLDARGRVSEVWPASAHDSAQIASREIDRMHATGPHSSATFPVGGDDVVTQPLGRGARVIGYVAIGCARPMPPMDRQLHLAACSLLALRLDRDHQAVVQRRSERSCAARLILAGHLDAARALIDDLEHDRIPRRVRLIGLRQMSEHAAADLLDRWEHSDLDDRGLWIAEDDALVWVIARDDLADAVLGDLHRLAAPDGLSPGLAAVMSPSTTPDMVPAQRRSLDAALGRTVAGQVDRSEHAHEDDLTARQVEALTEHKQGALVGTVMTFLRHRGHWEPAARALGVHRNTLRHRIDVATTVAGLDFDDADQTSRLWLALRDKHPTTPC